MTLQEFVQKWEGKMADHDGYYGGQCVDLMNFYTDEVLELPKSILAAPTAYQSFLGGNELFEKIVYLPGNIPQEGDIIYWSYSESSAGHVAIVLSADANGFVSLDQNWPVGSFCRKVTHTYKNIAGWLRYNQLTPKQMEELKKLREDLETLKKNVFEILQLHGTQITELRDRKIGKKKGLKLFKSK